MFVVKMLEKNMISIEKEETTSERSSSYLEDKNNERNEFQNESI